MTEAKAQMIRSLHSGAKWKIISLLLWALVLAPSTLTLHASPNLSLEDITFQDLKNVEYTLTEASYKDIAQNSYILMVKTSQGRYAKLKVSLSGLEGTVYNADGTEHLEASYRYKAYEIFDLDTNQVNPSDGDVYIDNRGNLGLYFVALNGSGFALADALIPLQFGTLSLTVTPDYAYVFVDGAYKGDTVRESLKLLLRKGKHQVKVAKPGYFNLNQEVAIEAGKEQTLSFELQPLPRAAPKWSTKTLAPLQTAPALGDFNQDGSLDILVASEIGTLYAFDSKGNGLWATKLDEEIAYSPAVGDLEGDGALETVVVGKKNNIFLLDHEGEVVWKIFPSTLAFTAAPVLTDLDGDDRLEILLTTREKVYVINDQGRILWDKKLEGDASYLSPPAVGDLEGDGQVEIVVLSRSRSNKTLYVLDANGEILDQREEQFSYNATPTLGDLDGDGKAEIVAAANFVEVQALAYPPLGEPLWTVQPHSFAATTAKIALGDLDGDGSAEVVVTSDRWIYVLSAQGKLLWQYKLDGRSYSAATLADLDGDGALEILAPSYKGRILAFSAQGEALWIFETADPILSSPVVGDVDGDGAFELLVSSDDFSLYALPAPAKGRVAWNGPRGSPRHTGNAQDALEYGRAIALGPQATALWTLGLPFRQNLPPSANFSFSPDKPLTRDLIRFDASASRDDDGTITRYLWNFGDGVTAEGPTVSHQYADNGTYAVSLTVTDDSGLSATATQMITVANTPPTAGFSHTPQDPLVLDTLEFVAQAKDPDGQITSWEWTLGDGTQASGSQVFHRYAQPGEYTVRLTVTDDDGDTAQAIQVLTVRALRPASAAPILRVEPFMLKFEGQAGGSDPPPQALTITIEGEGLFRWEATTDADWVVLGVPQGTLSGGRVIKLWVLVRRQGLMVGTYQGTITITVAGAQGSPARVPLKLIIKP